jgi:Putative MetA-pathway of phenol degradation
VRTPNTLSRLIVLVAGVAHSVLAFGGSPPLVTDDAETPGTHGWEIDIPAIIERTGDQFQTQAPLFDINYGIHDNDEFQIEFPVQCADFTNAGENWGIGDLLIGYKYRYRNEKEGGYTAGVYPQLTVPTGNARLNLGSGSTQLYLPWLVGKHFCEERYFLYTELGYSILFNNNDAGSWKFGVAGVWQVNKKLEIEGEVVNIDFAHGFAPDDTFFNVGVVYHFNKNVAFVGSAGRSFLRRETGVVDLMALAGLQFTWGPKEEPEPK